MFWGRFLILQQTVALFSPVCHCSPDSHLIVFTVFYKGSMCLILMTSNLSIWYFLFVL